MKKTFYLMFILFTLVGCQREKGFTLKKITSLHPPCLKWEVEGCSDEIVRKIAKTPCTYLGSGNHTYVFASGCGKYVIKFFKQKHMRTKCWADSLPMPAKRIFYPMEQVKRRQKEREDSYTSYKIAYEKLKKETGIVYLHLNKTDHLEGTLTLIDPHGREIEVKLDEMEFLIQKRGTLAFDHLKNLLLEGKYEEAGKGAISLLDVIAKRNQKGIYDKDLQFFKNFAFLKNQAIEVDIGEFRTDCPPPPVKEELQIVSYQIRNLVREVSPHHLTEIEKEIDDYIGKFE